MKLIRKHKELNREPIKFEKEIYFNWFNQIILQFNKKIDLNEEIIFNFKDIKRELNIKNSGTFVQFLKDFNDKSSGIFEVPKEKGVKIIGTIFSFKVDENFETIGVRVNGYFKDFIFSKLDIDTMKKFKKGSIEQVTSNEREYHEKNKKKYEQLFLEDLEIVNKIKGKYNKRIYQLLIQFKSTGKFWMTWEQFKLILEVPVSYKATHIDQKILNVAMEELQKVGLDIIEIKKIKKGRSIDKIEIFFKTETGKKTETIKMGKEIIIDPVLKLKNKIILDLGKMNN